MISLATADAAIRLARAIAVDIEIYQEEDVLAAKRSGVASDQLAAVILDGWRLYDARVGAAVKDRATIYEAAIRERVLPRYTLPSAKPTG